MNTSATILIEILTKSLKNIKKNCSIPQGDDLCQVSKIDLALNNHMQKMKFYGESWLAHTFLMLSTCLYPKNYYSSFITSRSKKEQKSYNQKYYKTLVKESKEQLTCYRNMSPADRDTFNSLFWICMNSISFSHLTDLATSSSTVLTTSDENIYLCLLWNLGRKTDFFCPGD